MCFKSSSLSCATAGVLAVGLAGDSVGESGGQCARAPGGRLHGGEAGEDAGAGGSTVGDSDGAQRAPEEHPRGEDQGEHWRLWLVHPGGPVHQALWNRAGKAGVSFSSRRSETLFLLGLFFWARWWIGDGSHEWRFWFADEADPWRILDSPGRRLQINRRALGWRNLMIDLAGLKFAFFVWVKNWKLPLLQIKWGNVNQWMNKRNLSLQLPFCWYWRVFLQEPESRIFTGKIISNLDICLKEGFITDFGCSLTSAFFCSLAQFLSNLRYVFPRCKCNFCVAN